MSIRLANRISLCPSPAYYPPRAANWQLARWRYRVCYHEGAPRLTRQTGRNETVTIYFYSPREDPYGCFSNFSRHGIAVDEVWWPTVEHYFQAQKFAGTAYAERILRASTPKQAATLGRSRAVPLRADWEAVKDAIMLDAVGRKFATHAAPRAVLLATGDEEIVENSPHDAYWGCGANGAGLNTLGHILMVVRERLRAAA